MLLISVLLISSYFLFKYMQEDEKQERIYNEVVEIARESYEESEQKQDGIGMKKLHELNTDIVAWLKIEGTQINFPIMQTPDKPNYYLNRDFYKNYSSWGTPFLAENCNIETSDNLIIHGHHIKNYKVFGELEKYRDKRYYETHKYIQFYTLNEKSKYEVICAFRTTIDSGFDYYNFIKTNDSNEFFTFIKRCKELSFYGIDTSAKYGDKLMTLSTCDYAMKNGRFVVIAKKI